MMDKKISIAVLLGGTSPEREVSKLSGQAMYNAVEDLGYDVKYIDPGYGINQPNFGDDYFSNSLNEAPSNKNYIEAINSNLLDNIDLALIALHGKWGEDGTIQSLLELKGINYTGSGVLGSSLSMDKAKSKAIFTHFDVSTPKWIVANIDTDIEILHQKIDEQIGYPIIVKPNDQGSTLGLTKCLSENNLKESIKLARKYSDVVLIEEFIKGREIAVGIINNQILPLLEIIPKHELYDYECKYTDGMCEYIVPANVDPKIEDKLKKQAALAFDAIGCSDYGRVDFRVTDDGQIYCFEVNTLPGMTAHSLVPKMAKANDISFKELLDLIIKSAL